MAGTTQAAILHPRPHDRPDFGRLSRDEPSSSKPGASFPPLASLTNLSRDTSPPTSHGRQYSISHTNNNIPNENSTKTAGSPMCTPAVRKPDPRDSAPATSPQRQSLPSIHEVVGSGQLPSLAGASALPTHASSVSYARSSSPPRSPRYIPVSLPAENEPRRPLSPNGAYHHSQPPPAGHAGANDVGDASSRLPTLHPLNTTQPPARGPAPHAYSATPSYPYPVHAQAYDQRRADGEDPRAHRVYASNSHGGPISAPAGAAAGAYPVGSTTSDPGRHPQDSWRAHEGADQHLLHGDRNRLHQSPYSDTVRREIHHYISAQYNPQESQHLLLNLSDTCSRIRDWSQDLITASRDAARRDSAHTYLPPVDHLDDILRFASEIPWTLQRLREQAIAQKQMVDRSREQQYDERKRALPQQDDEHHSPREHRGSGDSSGGPDPKKRRSRAAPPGGCHSCTRLETPEWRRGPDGARTLCNACGLHYAKTTRKAANNKLANGSSNSKIKEPDSP